MKHVTVSAPGKLMLFGEHAVVYGHPCIVTAVDQRMFCKAELLKENVLKISAPDVHVTEYKKPITQLGEGDIPKGAAFVETAVKNLLRHAGLFGHSERSEESRPFANAQDDKMGIGITTKSEFSSKFGFGSSSASAVCVIAALNELLDVGLAKKDIFNLAYETVLDVQGKGSGFDVAAAVYGGTLYFVTGGKIIEQLAPRHPGGRSPTSLPAGKVGSQQRDAIASFAKQNSLQHDNALPLVVGYSGVKADTVTLVNQVAEKKRENPERINEIFQNIEELVERAKAPLVIGDFAEAGSLMDENQRYLSELGVSSEKLDAMIDAARHAGAYGAKLSGAGGGDCMIGLIETSNRQQVTRAIEGAGGEIINVETGVEGVRVEE